MRSRHSKGFAIVAIAIISRLASAEASPVGPGTTKLPGQSIAEPVVTATGVIDEWEKIGKSSEWAASFAFSPRNSEARLDLAGFYLEVGKVAKAETLLREQIGRFTEPLKAGVIRPKLCRVLNLDAQVRRKKKDVAGEEVCRNIARIAQCREIECGFVGSVLFPEEYKRCRERHTSNESTDALFYAVLEAVEKRIPEAQKVGGDAAWNSEVEDYVKSGGPERNRDKVVLNSAYRSLAVLYAALGRTDKALQMVDAHVVDKNTGFRGPELFYERMLDAMRRHGQSQAIAKYLEFWPQSDDTGKSWNNRNYVKRYLVASLAKDGDVEAARKAATNAFFGEEYLILALLEMNRESDAWAELKSVNSEFDRFHILTEILDQFGKGPVSREKEAEFIRVVKAILKEVNRLKITDAEQVFHRLSALIRELDPSDEQRRLISPFIRDALRVAIERADFSDNSRDGRSIISLASACVEFGQSDMAIDASHRASERSTTIWPRGATDPVPIGMQMDVEILARLTSVGQHQAAIELYESWPAVRRKGHARSIVVSYFCTKDDKKANAIVTDELRDAASDGNTIAFVAIDLAGQGQFDKAMEFFKKYDTGSTATMQIDRIDEMRNAAVRYHLRKGNVHQALCHARQIISKAYGTYSIKQDAYYEIIKWLIRQERRERQ